MCRRVPLLSVLVIVMTNLAAVATARTTSYHLHNETSLVHGDAKQLTGCAAPS
jgi:hypothetical protein